MVLKICDIHYFLGNSPKIGVVGRILKGVDCINSEGNIYFTWRTIDDHYFIKFEGYAISVEVYNELIRNRVTHILIWMRDVDKYYSSKLEQWRQSERWINETLDGQIDNQYVLLLSEMELKGGIESEMASLKDLSKAYEPKKTKNIADLEVVNIDTVQTEERVGKNEDGKEFKYKVAVINGEEYRVPESVLGNIKTILSAKPNLKTIRVLKKGQGMNTEYTVVPLD